MALILELLSGTSGLHNSAFSQNVPVPLLLEAAEKAIGQHPKIRYVSLLGGAQSVGGKGFELSRY